jgi:hypothetical protein
MCRIVYINNGHLQEASKLNDKNSCEKEDYEGTASAIPNLSGENNVEEGS